VKYAKFYYGRWRIDQNVKKLQLVRYQEKWPTCWSFFTFWSIFWNFSKKKSLPRFWKIFFQNIMLSKMIKIFDNFRSKNIKKNKNYTDYDKSHNSCNLLPWVSFWWYICIFYYDLWYNDYVMKRQNEIYEEKKRTSCSFSEIWSIFWKFSKICYYHEFHFDDIYATSIMIYDITTMVWNVKMKFMKRKNGPVIGFSDFDQFFGNFQKYTITMSFMLMMNVHIPLWFVIWWLYHVTSK
jgi:hypothetical protein